MTPSQKFPTPLPSYPPLFTSPEAADALNRTVALHFLRTGQSSVAETFIEVGALHLGRGAYTNIMYNYRKLGSIFPQRFALTSLNYIVFSVLYDDRILLRLLSRSSSHDYAAF